MYAEKQLRMVLFERRLDTRGAKHTHVQVIPIPEEKAPDVRNAFEVRWPCRCRALRRRQSPISPLINFLVLCAQPLHSSQKARHWESSSRICPQARPCQRCSSLQNNSIFTWKSPGWVDMAWRGRAVIYVCTHDGNNVYIYILI